MWPAAAPAAFARMLAGGWLQDCITLLWVLPTRMRGAQASSRACERRPRGVRRHPALPLGCLPALCASSGRAGGVEDRRARLERDVAKHVRAGVQAKRHLGRHGGARRALAAAARGCVAVAECLDGVARHVDLVVLERVPAHPAAARRRVSAAAARARTMPKARRARRPPVGGAAGAAAHPARQAVAPPLLQAAPGAAGRARGAPDVGRGRLRGGDAAVGRVVDAPRRLHVRRADHDLHACGRIRCIPP